LLGGLIAAALSVPAAAQAPVVAPQTPPATRTVVLHGVEALAVALRVLSNQGQYAQALQLVQSQPARLRDDPAITLSEAQLQRRLNQPAKAADIYHRLLARFPNDQRVRLELAEALFEMKDLRASEYYFRLALSGAMPEADRRLARAYLSRVLHLRPWTITGSVGIAPDSNVNGATSAQQVELWGLPFQLADKARQHSGVDLDANLAGQGSVVLGPGVRLVGAAFAQARETRARAVTAGVALGPEWSGSDHRWSISGTGARLWYGGRRLYDAAGVSLAGDHSVQGGVVVYSGALSAQKLTYADPYQGYGGWLYGLEVRRTAYLSPQMFWRPAVSLRINRALTPSQGYNLGQVSVGLYRTLPLRLGLYIEPAAAVSRYQSANPLFAVVREDQTLSLGARLVKEDYSYRGFSPYLGASVSRTRSTIPVYSFTRQRVEVGVTRTF
jgi:hypothetical protein